MGSYYIWDQGRVPKGRNQQRRGFSPPPFQGPCSYHGTFGRGGYSCGLLDGRRSQMRCHRPELACRKLPSGVPGRLARKPPFGEMMTLTGKLSSGVPLKLAGSEHHLMSCSQPGTTRVRVTLGPGRKPVLQQSPQCPLLTKC